MNFERYDYTVGSQWLPVIFNDDITGHTDEELDRWDRFNQLVIDACGFGHWATTDEETSFRRCDVTGQLSECVDLAYMVEI